MGQGVAEVPVGECGCGDLVDRQGAPFHDKTGHHTTCICMLEKSFMACKDGMAESHERSRCPIDATGSELSPQ